MIAAPAKADEPGFTYIWLLLHPSRDSEQIKRLLHAKGVADFGLCPIGVAVAAQLQCEDVVAVRHQGLSQIPCSQDVVVPK